MKNIPPFTVNQGRLVSEGNHEVWIKRDDETQEIGRRIRFAFEAGRPYVDVAAMGATAVNQAVKGIAAVREYLMEQGRDLVVVPYWSAFEDDQDRERVRLVFRVEATG